MPTQSEARDKNKLIRQLSLVAYLMTAPQYGVSTWDIRHNVEEYADMSDDAFARRFYADRAELQELGIRIESGEQQDGTTESELYLLPPENYFLPEVEFSTEELTALHACLCLLDGQFAYSRPLRLALQSLALGTGNTLDEPVTDCINVNLLPEGDDAGGARLDRIEAALARRKTINFDYHAFSRDSVSTYTVDPYTIMHSRGDWYLAGYCHERDDVRIFRLRRIQGRIRNHTRREHDFSIPANYNQKDYLGKEPWQLGRITGTASIAFSPNYGWWADKNLKHCGTVEPAADGGAVFTTEFAGGSELCSLALGLWRTARLMEPAKLREQLKTDAAKMQQVHEGPPPEVAAAGTARSDEAGGVTTGEASVEPERFSRLATAVTYLLQKLAGEDEADLPVADACRDLGYTDTGQLTSDMELLGLVSIGGGEGYIIYAEVKGDTLEVRYETESDRLSRPPRLSPMQARALLLAIDLIGSQVLPGLYSSLSAAREKILKAAGGLDASLAIPVAGSSRADFDICQTIRRGVDEKRLVDIEYYTREKDELNRRTVEPYLIASIRGQWYVVTWCRLRDERRTFRFDMIKSATLLDERFTPRDIDLKPYRTDPRFPASGHPAATARVWFSPRVARWVREEQPGVIMLADGSLIREVPYFDVHWLADEILKYRGEAILLEPAVLRREVAETAEKVNRLYK